MNQINGDGIVPESSLKLVGLLAHRDTPRRGWSGCITYAIGAPAPLAAFCGMYSDVAKPRRLSICMTDNRILVINDMVFISVGPTTGSARTAVTNNLHFTASSIEYADQQADRMMAQTPAAAAQGCKLQQMFGDGMHTFTFDDFRRLAVQRSLGPDHLRDCGNGHWQVKAGAFNVNIYPYAHPPKYVLQGSGITPTVVEGRGSVVALVDTALQDLLKQLEASSAQQQATPAEKQATPDTANTHMPVEQILQEMHNMSAAVREDLKQFDSVEAVHVSHHTTINIIGTRSEDTEDTFLLGKHDGMLSAFKLVSELGEAGVELVRQQVDAMAAEIRSRAAEKAAQPAEQAAQQAAQQGEQAAAPAGV